MEPEPRCHCAIPTPWVRRRLNGVMKSGRMYLVQRTCPVCNTTLSMPATKKEADVLQLMLYAAEYYDDCRRKAKADKLRESIDLFEQYIRGER